MCNKRSMEERHCKNVGFYSFVGMDFACVCVLRVCVKECRVRAFKRAMRTKEEHAR